MSHKHTETDFLSLLPPHLITLQPRPPRTTRTPTSARRFFMAVLPRLPCRDASAALRQQTGEEEEEEDDGSGGAATWINWRRTPWERRRTKASRCTKVFFTAPADQQYYCSPHEAAGSNLLLGDLQDGDDDFACQMNTVSSPSALREDGGCGGGNDCFTDILLDLNIDELMSRTEELNSSIAPGSREIRAAATIITVETRRKRAVLLGWCQAAANISKPLLDPTPDPRKMTPRIRVRSESCDFGSELDLQRSDSDPIY